MKSSFKIWVVFDFDGTLADSAFESLKILKRLAPVMGFKEVDDEDVEFLRGKSTKEIIDYLEIGPLLLPRIVYRCRKDLEEKFRSIESHLSQQQWNSLFDFNCGIGIVTSNSTKNVESFLKKHNLRRPHLLHAGTSLFGKERILLKLSRQLKMKKGLYIGDETRDIVAAKKSGWVAAAVNWGFNKQETLESYGPYLLFTNPISLSSEIEKVVHSWQETVSL